MLHLLLPPTDRYRREWWWLALAWLVIGVLLSLGLGLHYQGIVRGERQHLAHHASVVRDNLARQLQVIDRALLRLRDVVSSTPDLELGGAALARERAQPLVDAMEGAGTFTWVWLDAQGQVRASNLEQLLGKDLSDCPCFRSAQQHPKHDRLLVGTPFESGHGLWKLPLARAVWAADGSVQGVLIVALHPRDFATLLRSVVYAPDMYVMLIHDQGQRFVWEKQPGREDQADADEQEEAALPEPARVLAQLRDSGAQQLMLRDVLQDGQQQQLVAVHAVQPAGLDLDHHLVVAVGRSVRAVFSSWRVLLWSALAFYVLVGLGVAHGLHLMQQHLRRQEQSLQDKNQALDNLWHAVLVATGQGVWDCNPRTGVAYYSMAWKALLGYDDADIGSSIQEWAQRVHPEDWPRVQEEWQRCLDGSSMEFDCVHRLRTKDGSYRWTHGKGRVIKTDVHGYPLRVVGTNTDLTELKRQAVELQEAQSMLQHLLHAMPVGLCMVDEQRRVYFRNQRFMDYFGYSEAEVPTMDEWAVRAYPDPEYRNQVGGEWRRALEHAATHDGYIPSQEYRITTRSGQVMLVAIGGLRFGSNLLVTFVDRTAEHNYSTMLEQLAFVDALTGLPNRRQFDQRLQYEWLRCRRNQQHLAVLMIDIDYFKQYNDHYGHQKGDECLRAVADVLRTCMGRSYDLVARYGGEEFVCLLPECTLAGAREKARQMLQAVRNLQLPHAAAKGEVQLVSISVGVASQVPDMQGQPEQLLAQADAQLYAAKEAGRNRVCAGPASAMES